MHNTKYLICIDTVLMQKQTTKKRIKQNKNMQTENSIAFTYGYVHLLNYLPDTFDVSLQTLRITFTGGSSGMARLLSRFSSFLAKQLNAI